MGVKITGSPPNKGKYKKWAAGSATPVSGTITVTGLAFQPAYIMAECTESGGAIDRVVYYVGKNAVLNHTVTQLAPPTSVFAVDAAPHTITASGFTLQGMASILPTPWIAFE